MADDRRCSAVQTLVGRHLGTFRENSVVRGSAFPRTARLVAVADASQVVRLVHAESGRTIARLESPESPDISAATFSSDGSRLVLVTEQKPPVHVWDIRSVRRSLVALGLDWETPAYSDQEAIAPPAPPLAPPHIDLGPLARDIEHLSDSPETVIERHTPRLTNNPSDAEAYHHRGHALSQLLRLREAIDDLTVAVRLRPDDAHLRETLALLCNNSAWELVTGPRAARDAERAVTLARRAVELAPNEFSYLNTLGVCQYRACQYAQATATLEQSLAAGAGAVDAFDLFFLAMAHHRRGDREQARICFDRAVRWLREQKSLPDQYIKELAEFRTEAKAVLNSLAGELPADPFAAPR